MYFDSTHGAISKISFGKPSFSIAKYGQSRNYFTAVREIFWRKPQLLKTVARRNVAGHLPSDYMEGVPGNQDIALLC